MKKCDCFIGFLCGEKVTKSTILSEVQGVLDSQHNLKKYKFLKIEQYTKNQILDGRKGFLSRFNYCCYCGEKINWKQIVNDCI